MAPLRTIPALIVRRKILTLKELRNQAMTALYPSAPPGGTPNPLVTLANTFSRYASTQQTAYDTGAARSTSTLAANVTERQVERALAQVVGPVTSRDGFLDALVSAFPAGPDGRVTTAPARSSVSLYGLPGAIPSGTPSTVTGIGGQISTEQANLFRQASIIAGDALQVLNALQPFAPEAERDQIEALRALIQTEIRALVDEFGRVDEPRSDRVALYFDALIGVHGHVAKFGERAILDRRIPAVSIADEAQIAGFQLLTSYVGILRKAWDDYNSAPASFDYPLFSDRLARASVLVPVIAAGNAGFMAAMDSIGFTEAERRSSATRFTQLSVLGPPLQMPKGPHLSLPDLTVNDLNEWIERFATIESPANLTDSGEYGLEFVTAQADSLFWVLLAILGYTKTTDTLNLNSMPVVAQVLLHERVSWALDDLLNQFKALADLAA